MADQNNNITIEGEIDAGWSQYGVPPQKGETVDATPKEEEGKEKMFFIPEEADDDLSDKEHEIIEAAVINADYTLRELADVLDWSTWTIQDVLTDQVPEWYETTFKQSGRSSLSPSSKASQKKSQKESNKKSQKESQKDEKKDAEYKFPNPTKKVEDSEFFDLIDRAGEVTANLCAEEFDITKEAVRQRLNKLSEEGYLEYEVGPEGYQHQQKVYTFSEGDGEGKEESEDEIKTTEPFAFDIVDAVEDHGGAGVKVSTVVLQQIETLRQFGDSADADEVLDRLEEVVEEVQ